MTTCSQAGRICAMPFAAGSATARAAATSSAAHLAKCVDDSRKLCEILDASVSLQDAVRVSKQRDGAPRCPAELQEGLQPTQADGQSDLGMQV